MARTNAQAARPQKRTSALILFHLLRTEPPQEDREASALVLGVVLETLALEVLHQVGLAVAVRFHKGLRYRQAELPDIAALRPEVYYGAPGFGVRVAQCVPRLREPLLAPAR